MLVRGMSKSICGDIPHRYRQLPLPRRYLSAFVSPEHTHSVPAGRRLCILYMVPEALKTDLKKPEGRFKCLLSHRAATAGPRDRLRLTIAGR